MHFRIGLCEFFLIRVYRLLCTCTQHDDDEYLMSHTNYMSHLKMFDDILIWQNKKRIYHNLWVKNKEGYKLTETPKAHRAQWKSVHLLRDQPAYTSIGCRLIFWWMEWGLCPTVKSFQQPLFFACRLVGTLDHVFICKKMAADAERASPARGPCGIPQHTIN